MTNWTTARDEEVLRIAQEAGWGVESPRMARQVGQAMDYSLSANEQRQVLARAKEIEGREKALVSQAVTQQSFDLDRKREEVQARADELFADAEAAESQLRLRRLSAVEGARIIAGIKSELAKVAEVAESLERNAEQMKAMQADPLGYVDGLFARYPSLNDKRENLL